MADRGEIRRLLVTGGCGFIGSNFIRSWLESRDGVVWNVDALTYAGDPRRLDGLPSERYEHRKVDIADEPSLRQVVADFQPDAVVHFAAESHVTRSENAGDVFRRTNVEGTRVLLEALSNTDPAVVIHISTDEVYGPCLGDPYREEDKEPGEGNATSPYARSKALADDVAMTYRDRLPLIVARPTNCFGPWQHPEKAFPRWVIRALLGQELPVWGDGGYIRDWLPVPDLCGALQRLLTDGDTGTVYNIGPERDPEITNAELARWILSHLGLPASRLVFTRYDRPDHDRRYAVDASRIRALGWRPETDVWSRFAETVEWFTTNQSWWSTLIDEAESIYADRAELKEVSG
jgi:dTDP-glucose 4,6-dehydratase